MKKRKRQTALPRVTVLAYSQRDLLAFTESVEKLRHLVHDLTLVVEKMPKPRAKKPPMQPPPAQPAPTEPNLFG